MKKLMVLVLSLVMCLSVCVSAQAVTELKWGSVHPETQVVTQMMMMAIDEINANAEDVHVTGYPNGVLGGSSDLVEGVQEGFVDIITEGPAQFAAWIPKAAQVEAPFLWQSV